VARGPDLHQDKMTPKWAPSCSCIKTDSRWNRKEVSRGSWDEALKQRPTSLRKSRPDLFSGPTFSKVIS